MKIVEGGNLKNNVCLKEPKHKIEYYPFPQICTDEFVFREEKKFYSYYFKKNFKNLIKHFFHHKFFKFLWT